MHLYVLTLATAGVAAAPLPAAVAGAPPLANGEIAGGAGAPGLSARPAPLAKSIIPKYNIVPSGTSLGISSMLNGARTSSTRVISATSTAKRA